MSLSLVFTEICFSFSNFLSYDKLLSFLKFDVLPIHYIFSTTEGFPPEKEIYIYVCVCVHTHVCIFPPRNTYISPEYKCFNTVP